MRRFLSIQKKVLAFLMIFIIIFTLFPKMDTAYSAGVIKVNYERVREDTLSGTVETNRLIIYGNGLVKPKVKAGADSEIPLIINTDASSTDMLVIDDETSMDAIEGISNQVKVFINAGEVTEQDLTLTPIALDLHNIPTITSLSKSKVYVNDPLDITGLNFEGLDDASDKLLVSGTQYDLHEGADADDNTADIISNRISISKVKSPNRTGVSDVTVRRKLGATSNEIISILKNSIRVVNRISGIDIERVDPNAGPRNKQNTVNIYGKPGYCNFSSNFKVYVEGVEGINKGTIEDGSGNVVGLSVTLPTRNVAGPVDILLATPDNGSEYNIPNAFVYLDIGNTLTIDANGINPNHKKETESVITSIKGRNIGYFNGVGYDKLTGVTADPANFYVGYNNYQNYTDFKDTDAFKLKYTGSYDGEPVTIIRQIKVYIDGEIHMEFNPDPAINTYDPVFMESKDTIYVRPNNVNLDPNEPKAVDVTVRTTTTVIDEVYHNDSDTVIYDRSEEYTIDEGFTYMPDETFPTINSLTPDFGVNGDNDYDEEDILMTITGNDFEVTQAGQVPTVTVGGRTCTNVKVYDSSNNVVDGKLIPLGTKIKCVLPTAKDHLVGANDLIIINPSGGQATKINAFNFKNVDRDQNHVPKINSVVEAFVDIKGGVVTGQTVLISGENFDTSESSTPRIIVTIDGEKATIMGKVSSDGKTVTVIPPPGTVPGATKLQLINEDGSIATANFEYKRITTSPKITKIVPVQGGKGTKLVIIGEDFVLPDDKVAPEDPKYKGTVILLNGKELNAYNYLDSGTVTTIDPVTDIDSNRIYFKGDYKGSYLDGEMVKVQSITMIYVDIPDKFYSFKLGDVSNPTNLTDTDVPLGDLKVEVLNPDGAKSKEDVKFKFLKPLSSPSITSILPNEGSVDGGTVVTIKGTNFKRDDLEVYFASEKSQTIEFVSSTEIRALVPAYPYDLPEGSDRVSVPVMVMNYDGGAAVTDNGFTYRVPGSHPTITSLSPSSGSSAGGEKVIIRGTDFRRDAAVPGDKPKVYFNGKAADVEWYGDEDVSEILIVTTPSSDIEGPVDVTLVNYDSGTCIFKSFTYQQSRPVISKVTPGMIKKTGGSSLQINGQNFKNGDFSGLLALTGGATELIGRNTTSSQPAENDFNIKVIFGSSDTNNKVSIDTVVGPFYAVMDDLRIDYSAVNSDTGHIKISKANDNTHAALDRNYKTIDGSGNVVSSDFDSAQLDIQVNSSHIFVINGEMDLGDSAKGDEGILVEVYSDQVIVTRRLATYAKVENNETQVTVRTPPINSIGTRTFSVENADGGEATATVTVTNPTSNPVITDISPINKALKNGTVDNYDGNTDDEDETYTYTPLDGGAFITINGSEFEKDCKVYLDTKLLEIVSRSANNGQLVVKVPRGDDSDLGKKLKIVVMNSDNYTDSASMAIPHYIVYQMPQSNPIIEKVTPDQTSSKGQNTVKIEGYGFVQGVKVYIEGVQVADANVTFITHKELSVKMPYGLTPGKKDVRIENPDYGNYTLADGITIISSPGISGVLLIKGDTEAALDPVVFSVEGGEKIKLTGSEFMDGARVIIGGTLKQKSDLKAGESGIECYNINDITMVVIGGTLATDVEVVDGNTITFTTPKLNVGSTTIIVINSDGGVSDATSGSYQKPLPDIPSGINLEIVDCDTIKIEWTKIDDIKYYEIYISASLDGKKKDNFIYVGSIVPSEISDTKLRYYIDGLNSATWYSVKLKSVNAYGPSTFSPQTAYKKTLEGKSTAIYMDSGNYIAGIIQKDNVGIEGTSVVFTAGEKSISSTKGLFVNFDQPLYMLLNPKYLDISCLLIKKYPGSNIKVTDRNIELDLKTNNLDVDELDKVDKVKQWDTKIRLVLDRELGARGDDIKIKLPRGYKLIIAPFSVKAILQVGRDTSSLKSFNGNATLIMQCSDLKKKLYSGGIYIAFYDKDTRKIVIIDPQESTGAAQTSISRTGEYMLVGKLTR